MSAFPNIFWGPDQEVYNGYTDLRHELGSAMYMLDGRRFRFCLAGASNLIAGTLNQSAVPVTNHILQTPSAAAAVGAQTISVTLGATAASADQYRSGMILLTAGNAGEKYAYPIDTHVAVLSAGVFAAPLKRGVTVQVATDTTASSASFYSNPFWKVVITPASAATSPVVGVSLGALTAANYGWLQTRGLAPVRADTSTIVVGEPVVASAAVTGDIGLLTTANFITNWTVGNCIAIGSSTHTALVDLRLE